MIKLLKNNINIITEIYKYYHLKKKKDWGKLLQEHKNGE